jgi:hypothetical protein
MKNGKFWICDSDRSEYSSCDPLVWNAVRSGISTQTFRMIKSPSLWGFERIRISERPTVARLVATHFLWFVTGRCFPPKRRTQRCNKNTITFQSCGRNFKRLRLVRYVVFLSWKEAACKKGIYIYVCINVVINLKLGCLHPVACIRSGSGVSV